MQKAIQDITTSDDIVIIKGSVKQLRGKKTKFIVLYDGTRPDHDYIQCTVDGKQLETMLSKFEHQLYKEAYLVIKGQVKPVPQGHTSFKDVEIDILDVLWHSPSGDFEKHFQEGCGKKIMHKYPELVFRMDQKRKYLILYDLVEKCLQETAQHFRMVKIPPPSFGDVKCEGGSDVFEMDYFGKSVYFSQSAQMYLEMITSSIKQPTWCLTKSYRAEKSRTKRHLTEYSHFEVEVPGFYDPQTCFDEFTTFLQEFVVKFLDILLQKDSEVTYESKKTLLESLDVSSKTTSRREFVEYYRQKPIVILSHDQAIQKLEELGIGKPDGSGFYQSHDDIPEAAERKLIDTIDSIVFLTKFPIMTKAFYTKTDPTDPTRGLAVDVEFPCVGEIIGSSLRESSYDELRRKLRLYTLRDLSDDILTFFEKEYSVESTIASVKAQTIMAIQDQDSDKIESLMKTLLDTLPPIYASKKTEFLQKITSIPYEDYEWYFALRKYGFPMSGGFGLGVERMITWIAGGSYDIIDTTIFPRTCDIAKP